MIPLWDAVEFDAIIRDYACQKVQPPGRAFGIGHSLQSLGQGEALHQFHNVDAALFQHRAVIERHLVHFEIGQSVSHPPTFARQKRGAHPPCTMPQPQVQTGGLHLFIGNPIFGTDFSAGAIISRRVWDGKTPCIMVNFP